MDNQDNQKKKRKKATGGEFMPTARHLSAGKVLPFSEKPATFLRQHLHRRRGLRREVFGLRSLGDKDFLGLRSLGDKEK